LSSPCSLEIVDISSPIAGRALSIVLPSGALHSLWSISLCSPHIIKPQWASLHPFPPWLAASVQPTDSVSHSSHLCSGSAHSSSHTGVFKTANLPWKVKLRRGKTPILSLCIPGAWSACVGGSGLVPCHDNLVRKPVSGTGHDCWPSDGIHMAFHFTGNRVDQHPHLGSSRLCAPHANICRRDLK
jgi:hypothetical protein